MSQDKGIVILVDDDKEMNSMTTEFFAVERISG